MYCILGHLTKKRILYSPPLVYMPSWVTLTSTCSSRSLVPSYQSILRPFQLGGSSTFIILSIKGCWHALSHVIEVFTEVWSLTLLLMSRFQILEGLGVCFWSSVLDIPPPKVAIVLLISLFSCMRTQISWALFLFYLD